MELPELLITLQEFAGAMVGKYGAWGVAAAMLLESCGVPFVSTAVLLTAGPMILSGSTSFWALMGASTAGIITGSAISYSLGYLGGGVGRAVGQFIYRNSNSKNSVGRSPARSRIYPFIEKYGTYSIFAGQLWGVTRTFISFPAGAMQMNLPLFLLFTALGGAAFSLWVIGWSLVLTGTAGLLLKYLKLLGSFSPWVWPAALFVAAALIYLFLQFRRKLPPGSLLSRFKK